MRETSRFIHVGSVTLAAWVALSAFNRARAAESRQVIPLSYGWNAVWLEVEPVDGVGRPLTADRVFRSGDFVIDQVLSPLGQVGTAEFTSNPGSTFDQGGWDRWTLNPNSQETSNISVRRNHGYLVHVSPGPGSTAKDGDPTTGLELQGQVGFYQPQWVKGSYNLVGFGVQGMPTFGCLLAGSGIVADRAQADRSRVKRLNPVTGAWEPVDAADVVESGRAYWIQIPYGLPGKGWAGPVETSFSGAVTGALDAGRGPGSLAVVNPADPSASPVLVSPVELTFSSLEPTGGSAHQITITRLAPAAADPALHDLQVFPLKPVALDLRWESQQVDLSAGWQALNAGAGVSRSVTVGVRRNWTTGANFREHLYRLSVSLCGGSVYRYLPVKASNPDLPVDSSATPTASSYAGFWGGQIALSSVTSLATQGSPVQGSASELSMPIFIHVDAAGQARLVPHSILMQTKTASPDIAPTPVLVVDESRIPFLEGIQQRVDGLRVGLRFETATFDLPRDLSAAHLSAALRQTIAKAPTTPTNSVAVTDADVDAYFSLGTRTSRPPDLPETYYLSWPLDGQLGVGKTLGTASAAPLTLDPFHRSNPFRHAFHAQHGAGYAITRSFTIAFDVAPAPTILEGTYQETTFGLARQPIVSRGRISLRRISTANSIQ